MAINPDNITTIRVDQLNSIGLTLESLFPHTNGTELTSSSIGDLATLVATTIESLNGIGFLPISVTDGQQLPDLPENPVFFLAGAGTYLNVNGFPDLICTENLNAIMSVTDHWEIAVEIPVNPLTGSVQSVTGSAVDNTDPLNPVINLSSATPDLQAVTDVGNETTNIIKFVVDADNYIEIDTVNLSIKVYADGVLLNDINRYGIYNYAFGNPDLYLYLENGTLSVGNLLSSDASIFDLNKIINNGVDYPLPTGVSSQIATLADITDGGVYTVVNANLTASNDTNYTVVASSTFTDPSPTEGKGYVVYVRNGTATIGGTGYSVGSLVFRVFHSGAWSTREYKSNLTASDIPSGIDATKIADGSVSNAEFQRLDGVTSNIQTQLNNRVGYLFKNTTQTVVTGTTSETIIYAEEVLANSISDNTILSFKSRFNRNPRVGTCTLKLYLNTVNNLSGSPVTIAQVTISVSTGVQPFIREQIFIKDNVLSVLGSSNALSDVTTAGVLTTSTYNINTTYYWILTAQPNTSTDSLTHNFSILERI